MKKPRSLQFLRVFIGMFFATVALGAWPQAHTVRQGMYELRASTVISTYLSEEMARKHGIDRDPRRAVLNVTVTKRDGKNDPTVHAQIQARVHNLTGQQRDIPLRETSTNGYVSYMGTYEFTHGEVLDFSVTAKPAEGSDPSTLTFRDRMWTDRKP